MLVVVLSLAALLGGGAFVFNMPGPEPAPRADAGRSLALPSGKGLNYGYPRTITGGYVGAQWLRSGTGREDHWSEVRPDIAADLDFIQQHHLGRLIRLFIGLDQLMVWDTQQGFLGFHEPSVANFAETLDLFDAHDMKIIAVLYDQEEVGNLGNFHFEALDGHHAAMRSGYLRATDEFLRRFGSRPTIVAWDLFNEAYNSLSPDGGLPKPPAQDPVSPNYSGRQVQAWLRDLYHTAKRAAPDAWFTVSDATELYGHQNPDLTKYDSLDFYDIHVYDDNPRYPNWKTLLNKPYIVGEAGASVGKNHLSDQRINARAVQYLLGQADAAGVGAVLLQSIDEGNVFPHRRDRLTPTGMVLEAASPDGSRRASAPTLAPERESFGRWILGRGRALVQRILGRIAPAGQAQSRP